MADDVIPEVGINFGMSENQVADAARLILDEVDAPYDVGEGGKMKVNVGSLTRPMQSKVKRNYAQAGVLSSMMKNGMGKSSLGWHISSKIARKKFSFENNFFFDGTLDDIKAQTDKLKTGNVLFMDELVRYWYNRSSMSKKSIDLNKWMAADQRKTGVILWGAIPDFWMLDPYLRNGRVDVYVECLARGWGVIFKSQNFVKTDPWHGDQFDRIAKMRSKRKGRATLAGDIELLQKHPCFEGLVFWNRMPHDVEKEYLATLKAHLKSADDDIREDTLDKFKREFLTTHEADKANAWLAVVNLLKFFEEKRGGSPPRSRLIKEAGIELKTLVKYEKQFAGQSRAQIEQGVQADVEKLMMGNRLVRKPSIVEIAPMAEEPNTGLQNFMPDADSSPLINLPAETEPSDKELVMAKPSLSFAERFPNLSNKRKFEEMELEEHEKKQNGETTEEPNDEVDSDEDTDTA